jgi:hypothetical protein
MSWFTSYTSAEIKKIIEIIMRLNRLLTQQRNLTGVGILLLLKIDNI